MSALSQSTRQSSSSGASQEISTDSSDLTDCGSVMMAVNATAACSKASSFVAPTPRTPMSASWGRCSQCASIMHDLARDLIVKGIGQPYLKYLLHHAEVERDQTIPQTRDCGDRSISPKIETLKEPFRK